LSQRSLQDEDGYIKQATSKPKMENQIMNWKRGFRRILFVLAIFAAIVCACLSIALVLLIHSDAQSNLRWKEEQYKGKYERTITKEQAIAELKRREALSTEDKAVEEEKRRLTLDDLLKQTEPVPKELEQDPDFRALSPQGKQKAIAGFQAMQAEKELRKLEKGFWVSLSKGGLVGLCGAVGLVGGIIGFVIVWLIYRFLEWLVLGFCDNNCLPPEKI